MEDEAMNLSKEAFEAASPKLGTGLVYAPYRTICSDVIVTGTGGEIKTRQKAYSRLIHGRIEDDIKQVLKKHIGKKLDKAILNIVIDPVRCDLTELFFQGFNSEFLNLTTFPIILNIEESEWKIDREVCKWLVSIFKEIGYPPFMDEDASYNFFAKEERKGYTKYKMYVNPNYPEGYWENHTL